MKTHSVALALALIFNGLVISTTGLCNDFLLAVPKSVNFVPTDPVLLFRGKAKSDLKERPGIPTDAMTGLNDPICATFSPSGELFVSNRHSNVFNGVGSIARFKLVPNGNWRPNGVITGNSLEAPHGLAFNQSGELFVANLDNGVISRFKFDRTGNVLANGTISQPGTNLGLAFSPTGELFANSLSKINRYLFDANGASTPNGSFTVPGADSIHFIAFNATGELFVPNHALNSNIYRFKFDAAGNPVLNGFIRQPTGAIGVAFSPTGEMFATSGSTLGAGGGIYRFTFDGNGNAVVNGRISVDQLGGPAILDLSPKARRQRSQQRRVR